VTTPTRAQAVHVQMIHVEERRAVTPPITSKPRISDFSSPTLLFVMFGPTLLFVMFEDCVCAVCLAFTSEELEEHDLIMRKIFKVKH